MKRFYLLLKTFLCCAAFIFISEMLQAQTIYYVTQNGAGNQSGSSWANAAPGTQLQTSINNAASGSQVWVAGGTYQPGAGSYGFAMKEGVKIYGGFAGGESSISQRNMSVAANKSILKGSGNLVIYSGPNLTLAACLDGFTITGGTQSFGGIFIQMSSPLIANCIITNNDGFFSSGLYIQNGSPQIYNCVFTNNIGTGGSAYACLLIDGDETDQPNIINCSFSRNSGCMNGPVATHFANLVFSNCIFWDNEGPSPRTDPEWGGSITINNSIVQGGYAGTGNLDTDPLFTGLANGDLHLKPNSPAINAGDNSANNMLTDLDGKPRKYGTIDMGAYEFQCPPIAITAQPTDAMACKGSSASFTISVAGNNLTYNWFKDGQLSRFSNNSSTLNITNAQPSDSGSYTVDVIGDCGKVTSIAVSLTVNDPAKPVVTVSDNCGNSILSTTATGTLLWNTGETTPSITATNAGNYSVTQTINGCISTQGSAMASPKSIPSTPAVTVSDNCGNSVLTTTATGTLLWSTGETTPSITVTNAENYSVTQTVNGCTSVAGSAIAAPKSIPSTPAITVSDNCGNSVLSTTTTGTLLWSTGETTPSITVTNAGNYSVTQTVNGCTSVAGSATAAPKTIPSAPAVTVSDNCGNSVLSTTATGTLLWNTGETTPSITVTNAGNYSVAQTISGCTSVAGSGTAAPKSMPSKPEITASGPTTFYTGGSVTLSAPAGFATYHWSNGATTQSVIVTASGSYSVVVTNSNGCNSVTSDAVVVTVQTPPSTLSVSYMDDDYGQLSNNNIRPYLQLNNDGNSAIAYKDITIRYWLTVEDFAPMTNLYIDWAQLGTNSVHMKYVKLGQPLDGAYGYIEYSFDASAGTLAAKKNSGPIQSRAAKSDWTNFNEADDYSYTGYTSYTKNNKITVYQNGSLVWGTEPAIIPAVQQLKAYSQDKSNSTTTNSISTWLALNNEGNTPVSYKDITMRYWFTADGNKPLNYYLDYAQLGNNNIKYKFVKLPTAFPTADTYLELSFTAPDSLYPISSSGNIQQRIAKSDWSNFNQLNDYSYQAGKVMGENRHITIYVKGILVYGQEPSANTQSLARVMNLETTAEKTLPLKVTLFNNPVIGNEIRFTVQAKQNERLHIDLVDISGKLIATQDFVQGSATDQHNIRINNVASGLLFLRVSTQSELQTVRVMNGKQ